MEVMQMKNAMNKKTMRQTELSKQVKNYKKLELDFEQVSCFVMLIIDRLQ